MADTKISALTEYTTTVNGDWIPIVDTTNSTTKKLDAVYAVNQFTMYRGQQKACIVGIIPNFTTTTGAVLHGNAAALANKIWMWPFVFPHRATFDLFNIGFGATNTGTADRVYLGLYDAVTHDLVHQTSVSFTAGATNTWASTTHVTTPELPQRMWAALVPELSTNTAADATLEYAASVETSQVPGIDLEFPASGAPSGLRQTDGVGRYTSAAIVRPVHPNPYTFPASINIVTETNPSNGAVAINMAYELPALRLSVNSTL